MHLKHMLDEEVTIIDVFLETVNIEICDWEEQALVSPGYISVDILLFIIPE